MNCWYESEPDSSGNITRSPGVRLRNPLTPNPHNRHEGTVTFKLVFGSPTFRRHQPTFAEDDGAIDCGPKARAQDPDTARLPPGMWARSFTVPPGGETVIPLDQLHAVITTKCLECRGPRNAGPMTCRDRHHRKQTIGGLAPKLCVVSEGGEQEPQEMHPALEERPPAMTLDEADRLLVERARARREVSR